MVYENCVKRVQVLGMAFFLRVNKIKKKNTKPKRLSLLKLWSFGWKSKLSFCFTDTYPALNLTGIKIELIKKII